MRVGPIGRAGNVVLLEMCYPNVPPFLATLLVNIASRRERSIVWRVKLSLSNFHKQSLWKRREQRANALAKQLAHAVQTPDPKISNFEEKTQSQSSRAIELLLLITEIVCGLFYCICTVYRTNIVLY